MLVNGSDFYCGNSAGSPCQLALKNQIPSQYVHPSTKQCNYSVDTSQFATTSELNSLKSSVSSGKQIVASAVTDKGVSTAADASFQTIANNINAISSITNSRSSLITTLYNDETYQLNVNSSYILVTKYDHRSGAAVNVDFWTSSRNLNIMRSDDAAASFADSTISSTGLVTNGSGYNSSNPCRLYIYELN